MLAQRGGDGPSRQRGPGVGIRRPGQDGPHPRVTGGRTQRQPRGVHARQLLAQPIDEPLLVRLEILEDAHPFTEEHEVRRLRTHDPERPAIRAQAIRQRPGIPTIVLRPCRRKAVPKPIELLRIERKHREAALKQGVDHHAAGRLDGDADRLRRGAALLLYPLHRGGHRVHSVRDGPCADDDTVRIDQAHHVGLLAPIHPEKPCDRCHRPSSCYRPDRAPHHPCTGASARLPTGCQGTAHPTGAHVSAWRSRRCQAEALPAGWPTLKRVQGQADSPCLADK